jgi:hypothetical protein
MSSLLLVTFFVQAFAIGVIWIVRGFRAAALCVLLIPLSWVICVFLSSMHMQWAIHVPWVVLLVAAIVSCLTHQSTRTR